jgi:hypothetical protein
VTLLAASSWPLGVLIALPVMGVLFFSAIKFAHNSRQRMANMLLGLLGSIAGLVAFVVYVEHEDRWLYDYAPVAAPVAMMVGAAMGVAVSVVIRSVSAEPDRTGSPPTDSAQDGLEK